MKQETHSLARDNSGLKDRQKRAPNPQNTKLTADQGEKAHHQVKKRPKEMGHILLQVRQTRLLLLSLQKSNMHTSP